MNKDNLEKFNDLLLSAKKKLLEELKNFAKENPNLKKDWESKFPHFELENFDIEEAADEVEEYLSRLPLEKQFEENLLAINEALERIKKGTYGKCENCDENIPQKRLEAIPETRICLKCKHTNKPNK